MTRVAKVLVVNILFAFILSATAFADANFRVYPADAKDVETALKLVLQNRRLTVTVVGYRGITWLTRLPLSDGRKGGGSATLGFTTWVDVAWLNLNYQLVQEAPGRTRLVVDIFPRTASQGINSDLDLIKEDILKELYFQVDYELQYVLVLKGSGRS